MSTDISVSRTTYQVENRSWLLSEHGVEPGTTPSATLDVSAFTVTNGYIPSGTVVSELASGKYGPFDAAAASGRHGILFSSISVPANGADVGGAVMVHGFVSYAKLPAGKPALAALKTALPLIHVSA